MLIKTPLPCLHRTKVVMISSKSVFAVFASYTNQS